MRGNGTKALMVATVAGVCAAGQAQGAEWTITPRLSVSETYTDNVTLASDEADEEYELITQINPGVTVQGEGARTRARLDYRMQNAIYARESNRNAIFHQLAADGNTELVEQTFFVDASAGYTQQIISPEDRIPTRNIDVSRNRTDVGRFSISPYAVKRFGSFASGTVRYTYDHVYYERGPVSNTDSNSFSASLDSGPRFNTIGWSLAYNRRDEERRTRGDTVRLETATARVNVRATAKLSFFVAGGYERNEFRRLATQEPEGSFWDAGFTWAPSPRTSIRASRGERFFGDTWSLNVSHRTRDTRWSARYREEVRTVQQLVLERQIFVLTDQFGNPIISPSGQPIFVETTFPVLTDEVFVERNASASVSKTTGKSTFALRLNGREREFQETGEQDRTSRANVSWTWRFATRTHSIVDVGVTRHERRQTGQETDIWDAGLSLVRRIRPNATGSIEYRHVRQYTDTGFNEYDQNVITARLNLTF